MRRFIASALLVAGTYCFLGSSITGAYIADTAQNLVPHYDAFIGFVLITLAGLLMLRN